MQATHAAGMDISYECIASGTPGTPTTTLIGNGSISVEINTANWGNECYWTITNASGTVVAQGGQGGAYGNNTQYFTIHCLAVGSYTFNWFDTWGDGWNGGSYTVSDPNGTTIITGSPVTGSTGFSSFSVNNSCTNIYQTTYSGGTPDTYKVRVKFYRDCSNGIPAPGTLTLSYNSNSCSGSGGSQTLGMVSSTNITPVCNTFPSPCSPSIVGIEEYIYEGTISLAKCSDWVLAVCVNARNAAISTGPNGSLCVQAELNNTIYCNNSPVFSEYPTPYICVGQNFCYNNGTIESDGDSLSYTLITPLNSAAGATVTYNPGLSGINPIYGTTTFDPVTGDLCITANQLQVSVVAMKVTEFRNGVAIGSVIRDLQVIVLTCPITPPTTTGFNGNPPDIAAPGVDSTSYAWDHCSNGIDPITFTIEAPGGASNNKIMSWNGLASTNGTLPQNPATYSVASNNSSNPIGTFNWVPDFLDVISSPFLFTVTVTDDACPINNTFSYTYKIYLSSSANFLVAENIAPVTCSGLANGSIDITVTGISGVPGFSWSGPNSFVSTSEDISSLDTGWYDLQITEPGNSCVTDYSYYVGLNSFSLSENIIDASCNGGSDGSIDLTVSGNPSSVYTYSWSNGSTSEDLSGIPAGSYSVVVTDITGCIEILNNIIVGEASGLTPTTVITSNYSGEHISCNGSSDGEITANIAGGSSPYTYSIDGTFYTSNNVFNNLSAGPYTIYYKDAVDCIVSENIGLSQPLPVIQNINSYSDISCYSSADGTIDITVTGGTSPYTYSWTGINGYTSNSEDLSNIPQSDTYTLITTDNNGCTSNTVSQYIQEPSAIIATTSVQSETCYGENDGSIDLTITGGSTIYNVNWTSSTYPAFNSSLQDLQFLSAGNYEYNIVDNLGCSLLTPAISVLVASASQIIVNSSVTPIDCYGNSNGAVSLTISGVTGGNANILWSGPNNFYSISNNISGLSSGVYTATITDPVTLCSAPPIIETINPLTTYNIDYLSLDISCKDADDGSVTITPYNLTNPVYNWIGPNGFTSSQQSITDLSPGSYQLQINDDFNCPQDSQFVITEPTSLSVLSSVDKVSCEGGSDGVIDLTASGGSLPYTYIWSNSIPNISVNAGLQEGSYTVTVLDANNCSWNEIFDIETELFDTTGITVTNVKCRGESTGYIDVLGVIGGVSPYTYLWNNGFTTQDLIYIPAGNYTVNITDATSCTISRTISVTEPSQALSSNVSTTATSCFSNSDATAIANPIGGVTPYIVEWFDNNLIGVDPDSLSIGLYQYEVTDANGCSFTDNFDVLGPDSMIVTATSLINVQCYGDATGEINLDVQFGTGTPPYTYFWIGPNFTSTDKDIYNLEAGEYICRVTDFNGCQVAVTYNITQPQQNITSFFPIASNYSQFNISCKGGNDGWINLNLSGNFPPFSYSWDNGETTKDIYGLSAGLYTVNITDNLGCVYPYIITLSEPDSIIYLSMSSLDYSSYGVSCYGFNDGLVSVDARGGVGSFSYQWKANNVVMEGQFTDTISNLFADNYQVLVTDKNGCQMSDTIFVTEPDPLFFDTIIFAPDTCELEKGSASVDILGGVPAYNYCWTDYKMDTISDLSNINNLTEGIYRISIKDLNDCFITSDVKINNLLSPIANFTANPSHKKWQEQLINPFIFVDQSLTFDQNIINWYWDFESDGLYDAFDSISSVSYTDPDNYMVSLIIETEYNCFDTINQEILVSRYELYPPNAFTPGGDDNLNSAYCVEGIGIKEFKIIIYSKWGGVVFTSDNINNCWDGTFNNEIITGIYTYYIEVLNIYDEVHKEEGTIKLIR